MSLPAKQGFWVRMPGGDKFRVWREEDSMHCSCRTKPSCGHLTAVTDYLRRETLKEKELESGLKLIAGKLEELVQQESDENRKNNWRHTVTGVRQIGDFVVVTSRIMIGQISREGIGSARFRGEASLIAAEKESVKAAAEKFPQFRSEGFDTADAGRFIRGVI